MSTDLSDLKVIKKLGEGSFAEVFKARSPSTGQVYAIKRLKKRYRSIDEVNKFPEILSLHALQGHPNIIKLVTVLFDNLNGHVAMVFELMDMNLYELLRDNGKPFSEDISLLLIYQLLKAIAFMHSKNLFHRDIKPENCMVNKSTYELKLCDFGSTRIASATLPYTEYVSTRWYRAPECILTSGSYGPEVDEWAVGCMLYELLTTRPLFPGKHEIDQISRIHNILGSPSRDILAQFKRNPNTQISFAFPTRQPQDLARLLPNVRSDTLDLIRALLIYNPRDRITSEQALKMPCFARLRQLDDQWQNAGCQGPFSVFAMNNQIQNPPPQPTRQPVPNSYGYRHVQPQPQPQKLAQPPIEQAQIITHQYPPVNIPQQKPKPVMLQPKPIPQQHLISKQSGPAMDMNLIESRMRAAERIREYNQKKYGKKGGPTKPAYGKPSYQKPMQFGPIGGYQKPRPDLVEPRLPKLGPHFVF